MKAESATASCQSGPKVAGTKAVLIRQLQLTGFLQMREEAAPLSIPFQMAGAAQTRILLTCVAGQ